MAIHAGLKKNPSENIDLSSSSMLEKSSLWLEYGLSLILKSEDWSVLITNSLDEKRIKDKKREHKRNSSESKKGKKGMWNCAFFPSYPCW